MAPKKARKIPRMIEIITYTITEMEKWEREKTERLQREERERKGQRTERSESKMEMEAEVEISHRTSDSLLSGQSKEGGQNGNYFLTDFR